MERHIGLDVHAPSCTVAVISEAGKRLQDFVVETNGQALVEAVRLIPGCKHPVFEEGLQSAWLYERLSPHVDEIVVAGIIESRREKKAIRRVTVRSRAGAVVRKVRWSLRQSRSSSDTQVGRQTESREAPA